MIKIYGMSTCPDCTYVEKQVEGNSNYEIIDIGEHVRNLKEFLKLRDSNPAFDVMKRVGAVGIPCFPKARKSRAAPASQGKCRSLVQPGRERLLKPETEVPGKAAHVYSKPAGFFA